MANTQHASLNATGLMPALTVNKLQESLDFFTGLGFDVEETWEENGALTGAMIKAGNARLGLNQDDGKKGRDRTKGVGMRSTSRPRTTSIRSHRGPRRPVSG